MPDFSRPRSKEGERLRRQAFFAAVNQARYPRTLENTRLEGEASADAAAWQLMHGDSFLKRHAAGEVIKAIEKYGGGEGDPSGTYGTLLSRICSQIPGLTLRDLIQAGQDPDRILAIVKSRSRKR
jgi:hypothetical protein